MTTTEETVDEGTEDHHPEHPSIGRYWQIALFLGIVTAVEIAIAYIPNINRGLLTTGLLVLGVVKFVSVVGWFMHLRFENKLMNRLFAIGLVLELGFFFVVLATFRGILAS